MKALGFILFNSDIYMFYDSKRCIYLVIYIDDFLIVAFTSVIIVEMRNTLAKLFELKNLGSVKLFFGIRIIYDRFNRRIYLD